MRTNISNRFMPLILMLLMVVVFSLPAIGMAAQATVNLGTTSSFAVLAGSAINY